MSHMKCALLLIIILSTITLAQDRPVYGEVSQLKGMTKVYVEGATSDERKMVLAQFKKDKTFTVVGRSGDAEFGGPGKRGGREAGARPVSRLALRWRPPLLLLHLDGLPTPRRPRSSVSRRGVPTRFHRVRRRFEETHCKKESVR